MISTIPLKSRWDNDYKSPQGPQIRLQVRLVIQSNVRQGYSRPSESSIVKSLALVRPCLRLPPALPPYSAHGSSFHISYYSLTIILVSSPTSSFALAVSMPEVYGVGYTPSAWDPRSLQSILYLFQVNLAKIKLNLSQMKYELSKVKFNLTKMNNDLSKLKLYLSYTKSICHMRNQFVICENHFLI